MKPPVITNYARPVSTAPTPVRVVGVDMSINDCLWLLIKFAIAGLLFALILAVIGAIPLVIFAACHAK